MEILLYIAWFAIVSQLLFLIGMFRNFKYTLSRSKKNSCNYNPFTSLIIPCKGIDYEFDKNIASFYTQDYENYSLIFVVESTEDPAYQRLRQLKDKYSSSSKAQEIKILIAGMSDSSRRTASGLIRRITLPTTTRSGEGSRLAGEYP